MDGTFKVLLNEYYKLKSKYEADFNKTKKKIINNPDLSKKEKQREFQRLKRSCVNCKKIGGTLFTNSLNEDGSRHLKARCGNTKPCDLNISLEISQYYLFGDVLAENEADIKQYKNEIIQYKNDILFGYASKERTLTLFDNLAKKISDSMELYSSYLEEYKSITDNEDKKRILSEKKSESYLYLQNIKNAVDEFNKTGNNQFVTDAVSIYVNSLKPLADEIVHLKYKQNVVRYNEETMQYHLIQTNYVIDDLEFNIVENKVIADNNSIPEST
uniref:Uncharacterized protein n=1 Tax=viral metagenome TaxID=1070528 RepID=A0A6C0LJY3_9ZZZZ